MPILYMVVAAVDLIAILLTKETWGRQLRAEVAALSRELRSEHAAASVSRSDRSQPNRRLGLSDSEGAHVSLCSGVSRRSLCVGPAL